MFLQFHEVESRTKIINIKIIIINKMSDGNNKKSWPLRGRLIPSDKIDLTSLPQSELFCCWRNTPLKKNQKFFVHNKITEYYHGSISLRFFKEQRKGILRLKYIYNMWMYLRKRICSLKSLFQAKKKILTNFHLFHKPLYVKIQFDLACTILFPTDTAFIPILSYKNKYKYNIYASCNQGFRVL